MRVKLDENLPAGLGDILREHGHDFITVPQQGLTGESDASISEAAQRDNRLLITLDLDFADIRRFHEGSHPGILVLRPSRRGRAAIRALLQALLARQSLDALQGCIAIADETRIRIRRA